jgi:ABC-type molybdenum transport system ATPase subunit/photorepair protein PhrA
MILRDIDICIDHGQHWAIIGQNGSGKTSLISIINGYHQPSEGKACVLGKNSALPTCGNCDCIEAVQKMCIMAGGPTLIYITHHIEEILPSITHVVALRKGKVIASGEREEVLTNEVLSRTFEVPVELHKNGGRLWVVVYRTTE